MIGFSLLSVWSSCFIVPRVLKLITLSQSCDNLYISGSPNRKHRIGRATQRCNMSPYFYAVYWPEIWRNSQFSVSIGQKVQLTAPEPDMREDTNFKGSDLSSLLFISYSMIKGNTRSPTSAKFCPRFSTVADANSRNHAKFGVRDLTK